MGVAHHGAQKYSNRKKKEDLMSIFGKALRGFGMLKKTSSAKKKFDAKRKVFGDAAFQNEIGQTGWKSKKNFIKQLKKQQLELKDK